MTLEHDCILDIIGLMSGHSVQCLTFTLMYEWQFSYVNGYSICERALVEK